MPNGPRPHPLFGLSSAGAFTIVHSTETSVTISRTTLLYVFYIYMLIRQAPLRTSRLGRGYGIPSIAVPGVVRPCLARDRWGRLARRIAKPDNLRSSGDLSRLGVVPT